MNISIIIPTYNGGNRVLTLVGQLLEWENSFELIVVNDGSSDDTLSRLKLIADDRLIVVSQRNRGRASARNSGAAKASKEILWFLDDDMTTSYENLEKIGQHFENHPGSVLVGGQFEQLDLCISDIQKFKAISSLRWQQELGSSKTKLDQPYITAANFSIERKQFDGLNGFDDRLRDTEDYDFALRATKKGLDIYFDPEFIGLHVPIKNAVDYCRRLKEYDASEAFLRTLKPELPIHPPYRPGPFKKVIYSLFYSEKWLHRIDKEELNWLPQNFRYWLYRVILTSQSKVKQEGR